MSVPSKYLDQAIYLIYRGMGMWMGMAVPERIRMVIRKGVRMGQRIVRVYIVVAAVCREERERASMTISAAVVVERLWRRGRTAMKRSKYHIAVPVEVAVLR